MLSGTPLLIATITFYCCHYNSPKRYFLLSVFMPSILNSSFSQMVVKTWFLISTDAISTVPFISLSSFWYPCLKIEFSNQPWFHSHVFCGCFVGPSEAFSIVWIFTSSFPHSPVSCPVHNTVWICRTTFFLYFRSISGNTSDWFDFGEPYCYTRFLQHLLLDVKVIGKRGRGIGLKRKWIYNKIVVCTMARYFSF